jgi:hypothetical protein
VKGDFVHHRHGEDFHNAAIMIFKSVCSERGHQFLDPTWLRTKGIYSSDNPSGDPDIYIRVQTKKGGFYDRILELDTHPTKASDKKKAAQFRPNGVTDLQLIDLRDIAKKKDGMNVTLGDLYAFARMHVPEREISG